MWYVSDECDTIDIHHTHRIRWYPTHRILTLIGYVLRSWWASVIRWTHVMSACDTMNTERAKVWYDIKVRVVSHWYDIKARVVSHSSYPMSVTLRWTRVHSVFTTINTMNTLSSSYHTTMNTLRWTRDGEVGGWGRVPFSKNLMKPTPRRKWYLTTGRRFH